MRQLKALLFCLSVVAAPLAAQESTLWYQPQGPSSFKTKTKETKEAGPRLTPTPHRLASHPRVALGVGLNVPEIYPIEAMVWINRYVSLRAFYVMPIRFKIRVEMPADVISTKGVQIENPRYNINFNALYGPQYGLEAMSFPFGGGFHLFAGLSARRLSLKGGTTSKLLIRPQGGGDPLLTNSSVQLETDAATSQKVIRAGIGYILQAPFGVYMNTFIGYSKPYQATSRIAVRGSINNNAATNAEDYRAALDDLETAKKQEMEAKALKAMAPVERLAVPILGFSFGVYF